MLGIRALVCTALGVAALAAVALFSNHIGGLSVRVRSLFIKHTKTGNPLVDSVAEHQPASVAAYWHYLNYCSYMAPLGLVLTIFRGGLPRLFVTQPKDWEGVSVTKWFIICYAVIAYYFANRMQRLIILLGPMSSVLSGIAVGEALEWSIMQPPKMLLGEEAFEEAAAPQAAAEGGGGEAKAAEAAAAAPAAGTEAAPAADAGADAAGGAASSTSSTSSNPTPKTQQQKAAEAALKASSKASAGGGKGSKASKTASGKSTSSASSASSASSGVNPFAELASAFGSLYKSVPGMGLRFVAASAIMFYLVPKYGTIFYEFSDKFAQDMSQPSIKFKAKLQNGQEVMIDDYVEAYEWLSKSTPLDARVLSWWDYGYQITGIGNRTSLADGNTWNLEHIALLGRMLTSPEKRAHSLARHLADYVLIWAGNQGDDLSKSPHMARIGSSVYPDICPQDPLCRNFGFDSQRKPTPSMAASMLYKMHRHNLEKDVKVNPKYFEDVFSSKYGLVRIFKILNVSMESRNWLADPANRKCDRPGSWYCPGQYPPGFEKPPSSHRNLDYDDSTHYVEEQ